MNNSEIAGDQYLFLQKSFNEFNQATTRLQKAFANLEQKFEQINKELELKNEELKQTIEEKEKVKNYLRNILESLTNGVVVTDLDGKITTLNRCAETFFGIPQDHIAGKDIKFLFDDLNIADWKVLPRNEYLADTGGKVNLKDRIIEIFVSPMKAEQGEIIGTVFILRDITRIEKLEEMANSLLMKDLKDKNYQGRLSHIITSVKNMDNKISNLLLFTTQRNPMMRNINLHRIMKEVLRFSDPIIKQEGITLSVSYSGVEPYVRGDAEMLKQVFLNILLNSIQAMIDGGSLRIETIVSRDRVGVSTVDRNVEVRISDTGVGIPRENLKKIFDPFFSTRERGSGLGLAIVHNIVHVHNGSIDVESKEKEGTVFSILLPLIQETRKSEVADSLNILGDRHE